MQRARPTIHTAHGRLTRLFGRIVRYTYQARNQVYSVELERQGDRVQAIVNGQKFDITLVRWDGDGLAFMVGKMPYLAYLVTDRTRRWIFFQGRSFLLEPATFLPSSRADGQTSPSSAILENMIRAPMPGQVRAVYAAQGDPVEKGQTLLLLEAMKMEIRIQVPRAGRLRRLGVQTGQAVERDEILAEID